MKHIRVTIVFAVVVLSSMLLTQEVGAQTLRVTLLGTGTPTPSIDRFSAATLVEAGETRLLFDAGRGVVIRLSQIGLPAREIDGVFITHFHHDHLTGLADLWITSWLPTPFGRRTAPLAIWGPEGLRDVTDGLQSAYARDIAIRSADEHLPIEAAAFEVTEFSGEGVVYDTDGVQVTAFPVNHGELIQPAYGYRVDYGEHSVLISGDTRFDERVIDMGRGVDVLIHEVVTGQDRVFEANPGMVSIRDHHTTPAQAGSVFAAAQPKLAVFSHLVMLGTPEIPPISVAELVEQTRKTYSGPLVVGHDLMTIDISDTVSVYDRP